MVNQIRLLLRAISDAPSPTVKEAFTALQQDIDVIQLGT